MVKSDQEARDRVNVRQALSLAKELNEIVQDPKNFLSVEDRDMESVRPDVNRTLAMIRNLAAKILGWNTVNEQLVVTRGKTGPKVIKGKDKRRK